MMKSYVVVGLGYGDEGKGATTDFLCHTKNAECVVKYSGGHQAGHRVVVGDKEHVFAQYGAGALAGAYTILDRDFIIEPLAMRAERAALETLGGNTQMFIHPECQVTTRYHRAYNRLMGGGGTCGLGVGITRQTYNIGIGLSFKNTTDCEEDVRRIRSYLLSEAKRHTECQVNESFMEEINTSPKAVADEIRRALCNCHARTISRIPSGTTVFEGSQGVLLDETHGDVHATYSTVTPRNAFEFPGFDRSNSTVVGVMRSYMTRHGYGPFPSMHLSIGKEDANNGHNPWQGAMKSAGWCYAHLRRALAIAKPDVLAVNHLDVQACDILASEERPPVMIEGRGQDRSDRKLLSMKRFPVREDK